MSILNAYRPDSEPIISASHIFQPIAGFPKIAVGAFKEIEPFLEPFVAEEIAAMRITGLRFPVWRVNWQGTDIAIFNAMLGGPASVGMMEEVAAMGARKFLFYGSCGVLDREIAAGGLILPTAAYRDEGASYHYAPSGNDYIEIKTAGALREILRSMNLPCVTTKTWTTDAIFRETRAAMEARRAEGCGAVDMECASLMAAAQFYGYGCYQFFCAEDCLDGETWDRRNMGSVPVSEQEAWLRLAIEIAARLNVEGELT